MVFGDWIWYSSVIRFCSRIRNVGVINSSSNSRNSSSVIRINSRVGRMKKSDGFWLCLFVKFCMMWGFMF